MMRTVLGLVFLLIGTAFAAPTDQDDQELQELMRELQELKEARETDQAEELEQLPYEQEDEGYNEDVARGQEEDLGEYNNFDQNQEDLWEREEDSKPDLLQRGDNEMDEGVLPNDEGFNSGPVEDEEARGWYDSLEEDETMDARDAEEAAGMTEDEADEIAQQILDSGAGQDSEFVARAVDDKVCVSARYTTHRMRAQACRRGQEASRVCTEARKIAAAIERRDCL